MLPNNQTSTEHNILYVLYSHSSHRLNLASMRGTVEIAEYLWGLKGKVFFRNRGSCVGKIFLHCPLCVELFERVTFLPRSCLAEQWYYGR